MTMAPTRITIEVHQPEGAAEGGVPLVRVVPEGVAASQPVHAAALGQRLQPQAVRDIVQRVHDQCLALKQLRGLVVIAQADAHACDHAQ